MKRKPLNRIISLIREEMMTTQSTAGKPGCSSKADAEGPTAGFDPVMKWRQTRKDKERSVHPDNKRKQKKYIKLPPGSRKRWMKNDES